MKHSISIYACGGLGANIVSKLENLYGKEEVGYAKVTPYYIDTSASNLTSGIDTSRVFLFDDRDGSGKKKDTNYDVLSGAYKAILAKFKPSEQLNIVVHSGGGGTGPVAGNLIVSELLSKKLPVVVFMVGSTDSLKEAENTLGTLQSYERISRTQGIPINVLYSENNRNGKTRKDVDTAILQAITITTIVASGDNKGLDTADVRNFLNFSLVTSYPPKLYFFDYYSKDVEVSEKEVVCSLLTLSTEEVGTDHSIPAEYRTDGLLPEGKEVVHGITMPIQAACIDGRFYDIFHRIQAIIDRYNNAREAVLAKTIPVGDNPTSEGLIL
jgi:hypothetical protein